MGERDASTLGPRPLKQLSDGAFGTGVFPSQPASKWSSGHPSKQAATQLIGTCGREAAGPEVNAVAGVLLAPRAHPNVDGEDLVQLRANQAAGDLLYDAATLNGLLHRAEADGVSTEGGMPVQPHQMLCANNTRSTNDPHGLPEAGDEQLQRLSQQLMQTCNKPRAGMRNSKLVPSLDVRACMCADWCPCSLHEACTYVTRLRIEQPVAWSIAALAYACLLHVARPQWPKSTIAYACLLHVHNLLPGVRLLARLITVHHIIQ